jgi:acetyltransferase-like isoleucine patch superfamily enzyme
VAKSANQRAATANLPDPERASDAVITRCRAEIEGWPKALARKLFVPYLRQKYRLAELGEGFHWPRGGKMVISRDSKVGRFTYLGAGFEAYGPVVVGDLCMVAAGCKIVGADHRYDELGTPMRIAFPEATRPVTTLGLDAWLGQRVTVVEGVTIGAGAVVGSGSMVTKDVEPYAIVAGVPARFIKWRFTPEEIVEHEAVVRRFSPVVKQINSPVTRVAT